MPHFTPQSAQALATITAWAGYTIARHQVRRGGDERGGEEAIAAAEAAWNGLERILAESPTSPLPRFIERQGLTGHELRVVLFLLATRVDGSVVRALATLRGGEVHRAPTVTDLMHVLGGDDSAWMRAHGLFFLDPEHSLVRRCLCEAFVDPHHLTSSAVTLTTAALTEALGFPIGAPYVRYVEHVDPPVALPPVFEALSRARERGHSWVFRFGNAPWHLVWSGSPERADEGGTQFAVSAYGCAIVLDGVAVADSGEAGRAVVEAVQFAVVKNAALVITGGDALLTSPSTRARLLAATREGGPPIFVAAGARHIPGLDSVWTVVEHVQEARHEGADAWRDGLARFGLRIDGPDAEALAADIRLDSYTLGRVVSNVAAMAADGRMLFELESVKRVAQAELDHGSTGLARRIEPKHGLDAVIVTADFRERIKAIVAAATGWFDLLGHWGFGRLMTTGRAVTCLFSGEPGTGKTHSAEAIAAELGRPLLMASVPGLTSKWMGETERNLRDLFAAAQAQRAVLLFDEADALFGTRVEAKSSHDHDRNMQTGAILQELDRHSGLVILTTNLNKNIDRAFQRRMMFTLDFPFPDAAARLALWRHLLPREALVDRNIAWDELAHEFELSGGEIRNVILRAASDAWSRGSAITGEMIRQSAILEYQRMGRLVSTR